MRLYCIDHRRPPHIFAGLLVFAWFGVASAYYTGPLPGRTGAPGELTCDADGCHNTYPLNSGNGTLAITGNPAFYGLGTPYTITVTINQAGQTRWGFELCAKTADGSQAGTITLLHSDSTQTILSNGITYVEHTETGTDAGHPGPKSWSFTWTAPATGVGTVTFYAAGNAANNNNLPTGDYIYTTSVQSNGPTTGVREVDAEVPSRFVLGDARPNPFNPSTTIPFAVPTTSRMTLRVYSLTGQAVKTLVEGTYGPGRYNATWDGTDDADRGMASGPYLVVLHAGNVTRTRLVVLAR